MPTRLPLKLDRQCFVLTVIVSCTLTCGNFASAQIEDNHVVHVTVTDENDVGQSATGFLWKNNKQVVTSLHGVLYMAMPNHTIKVYCKGIPKIADVSNVLQMADLVILTTKKPVNGCKVFDDDFQGMNAASLKPEHRTALFTIGWKGSAGTAVYRDLQKGKSAGRENLEGLVSTVAARKAIRALGLPAMNLDIYLVTGDGLGGGFSGGPVVDGSGRLVGIVDGGLDKGAGDYNWLVPATFLNDFKSPNDTKIPTVNLDLLDSHFSAGLVEPAGTQTEVVFEPRPQEAQDGSRYQFVKTKTRRLSDLIDTSDEDIAVGIRQLVQTYQRAVGPDGVDRLRFDIFEDIDRGLIITVPHDQSLIDGPLEKYPDIHRLRSAAEPEGVGWMHFEKVIHKPDEPDDPDEPYSFDFDFESALYGADGIFFPEDDGYFDAYIEQELRQCWELWHNDCHLDAPTKRITRFLNGDKVLNFGIHVSSPTQPDPTYYDYTSVAVRDNIAFIGDTRIVIWDGDDALFQCNSVRPCSDTRTSLQQLSLLVAVQLTTFASER